LSSGFFFAFQLNFKVKWKTTSVAAALKTFFSSFVDAEKLALSFEFFNEK